MHLHGFCRWFANMGIFQDDPTFDDFLAEVNTLIIIKTSKTSFTGLW